MAPKKEADNLNKSIIETIEKCLTENSTLISKIADLVVQKIKEQIDDTLKKFQDKVDTITNENKKLHDRIIFLEQATKKNNIRITGVAEEDNENIKLKVVELFEEKLNVNINMERISCYRNNVKENNKTRGKIRPITVKFDTLEHKQLVIKNRNKLKNSNIFISDDLVIDNVILLNEAKKVFGKKKAWSMDGNIFVSGNKGKIRIRNLEDLIKISSA